MKPIKMSPELYAGQLAELCKQFEAHAKEVSLGSKQEFRYTWTMPNAEGHVAVNFTPQAYNKMMALVNHFSSEIAWNGLVNRISDTEFEIYDIVVYPQTVTGATVSTDQARFEEWLDTLSDEDFAHRRMQGHSHVNMGVTPSGTDISDQERLVSNLRKDDYYIILIWNKREEYSIWVYDMAQNVVYDNADITVTVGGVDLSTFLDSAEKMLDRKTISYGVSGAGTYNWQTNTPAARADKEESCPQGQVSPYAARYYTPLEEMYGSEMLDLYERLR